MRLQRPGYHYFYHFPLTVNDVSQDVLGVIQQYWYLIESARSEESNELCSRSRTPMKSGRKGKRTGKMMPDSNGDACQFDPCTAQHASIRDLHTSFCFFCLNKVGHENPARF